ncbi:hypothetical protein AMJ57_02210 [Parcubacteria bacterium SG8_24]|nr:MAG: hypothetical protein AMJ57_02210 [Parcubacteria bacterium SG8_24]
MPTPRLTIPIALCALIALGFGCIGADESGRQTPDFTGRPAPTRPTMTPPGQPDRPTAADSRTGAPFFMTTMTHMEGPWKDDVDQALFLRHVEQLRFGIGVADSYGAKLTIESEKPFARGCDRWDVNMMKEVLDSGHGVGTHCDFGARDAAVPPLRYSEFFKENKDLVDALVGAENNRGCSGGGGASDWAIGATLAGFKYLDGIVGLHYLSMPLSARPDSDWTDENIRDHYYHDNAPVDLVDRLHPFMVKDAQDFVADPDGTILVSSGEFGRVDTYAEGGDLKACAYGGHTCPITEEDVDAIEAAIREAIAQHDDSRVGKLTVYLPVSLFAEEYESGLELFFGRMQEMSQEGLFTWATQGEVYDAYISWGAGND